MLSGHRLAPVTRAGGRAARRDIVQRDCDASAVVRHQECVPHDDRREVGLRSVLPVQHRYAAGFEPCAARDPEHHGRCCRQVYAHSSQAGTDTRKVRAVLLLAARIYYCPH